MNRYPWWKYLIIAVALLVGLIYTLPNFFGEAPAVQLSSGKATIKLSADDVARVETVLKEAGVTSDFVELDGTSVRARFKDTDTQIKARDALNRAYNPDAADPRYIVALNLVSRSPHWLRSPRAHPMFLGPDLRGWHSLVAIGKWDGPGSGRTSSSLGSERGANSRSNPTLRRSPRPWSRTIRTSRCRASFQPQRSRPHSSKMSMTASP